MTEADDKTYEWIVFATDALDRTHRIDSFDEEGKATYAARWLWDNRAGIQVGESEYLNPKAVVYTNIIRSEVA